MTQAEKELECGGKEKEKERDKEKEQQRGVKRPITPAVIPEATHEVRLTSTAFRNQNHLIIYGGLISKHSVFSCSLF